MRNRLKWQLSNLIHTSTYSNWLHARLQRTWRDAIARKPYVLLSCWHGTVYAWNKAVKRFVSQFSFCVSDWDSRKLSKYWQEIHFPASYRFKASTHQTGSCIMITHVSLCAVCSLPNQSEILLTVLWVKSELKFKVWADLEFVVSLAGVWPFAERSRERRRQNTSERDHNILFVNLQAAWYERKRYRDSQREWDQLNFIPLLYVTVRRCCGDHLTVWLSIHKPDLWEQTRWPLEEPIRLCHVREWGGPEF